MTIQPELPLSSPLETRRGAQMRKRWERFHEENGHIYCILRDLAMEAVKAGRQRGGIAMLWEVMRWRMFLATTDEGKGGRKLNNDYKSRYARLLMAQEPELSGFFEVRELRA